MSNTQWYVNPLIKCPHCGKRTHGTIVCHYCGKDLTKVNIDER